MRQKTTFGLAPEIRSCFAFAAALDRAHGRESATVAAAYYGLSFDATTLFVLAAAGARVAELRLALQAIITRTPPAAGALAAVDATPYRDGAVVAPLGLHADLDRLTRRAAKLAHSTGHRELGGRHFLVALLAEQALEACRILLATGFDVRAMPSDAAILVRRRTLEAAARSARDLPPGDTRVVVHDDDRVTLDLVIGILTGVLGLPMQSAMAHTIAIHKSGRSAVATFARAEAEEKARVAMKLAADHGTPLLVTTEPV